MVARLGLVVITQTLLLLRWNSRRAFWVFQMQHALEDLPELEDITPPGFTQQDPLLKPMPWKRLLAEDSLALPLLDKQPGFTSAYSIGQVSVVAADLRTERSRTQIMGSDTWKQIKEWTDNCRFFTTLNIVTLQKRYENGLIVERFYKIHCIQSFL